MCKAIDPQCSEFDYSNRICKKCANGYRPSGSKCIMWFEYRILYINFWINKILNLFKSDK